MKASCSPEGDACKINVTGSARPLTDKSVSHSFRSELRNESGDVSEWWFLRISTGHQIQVTSIVSQVVGYQARILVGRLKFCHSNPKCSVVCE